MTYYTLLKKILDPPILLKKIRSYWAEFYKDDLALSQGLVEVDTMLLERMAHGKHSWYVVVDAILLKILYAGKNAEEFTGYTDKEVLERDFMLFFHAIKWKHLFFFAKFLDWAKVIHEKFPVLRREYISISVCGITFKHKTGRDVKLFFRIFPLDLCESGFFRQAILEFVDVTNMLKTDEYWMHATVGKEKKKTIGFFSDKKAPGGGELITERELEVLTLVAESMQTKEIAEKLFISPATVEKHRKNMIARVGVKDTMALVEICRRCGIL